MSIELRTKTRTDASKAVSPVALASYSLEELVSEIERRDGTCVLDIIGGIINDTKMANVEELDLGVKLYVNEEVAASITFKPEKAVVAIVGGEPVK